MLLTGGALCGRQHTFAVIGQQLLITRLGLLDALGIVIQLSLQMLLLETRLALHLLFQHALLLALLVQHLGLHPLLAWGSGSQAD